jgi:FkbM family methyltransferase
MQPFQEIKSIANLSRQEFETTCSQFTEHAYLGDHLLLCKVLTKYKMYVDTRDLGIAPHLIMDGFWESWLTQCLADKVKPGFVCLDIGANLGYYSLLMSELSGHNGRTVAIEPNPAMVRLMRFSEFVHGWKFDIVDKAISDKIGKAVLTIPEGSFGGATLSGHPGTPFSGTTRVKVATTTVDAIAEELQLPRIDMIKIDVEGFEPLVFEGMKKTLAQNPQLQVIMEYSPFSYPDAKKFSDFIFNEFTVYRIKDVDRVELVDFEAMQKMLSLRDHTDLHLIKK